MCWFGFRQRTAISFAVLWGEKEDAVKTTRNEKLFCAVAALMGSATSVFAAPGGDNSGGGILLTAFLIFGALIIVFQLIPGIILFVSMLKGLFAPGLKEKAAVISEKNGDNH
jgi:hypothetical protein